jgi:carboxypeptidase Q
MSSDSSATLMYRISHHIARRSTALTAIVLSSAVLFAAPHTATAQTFPTDDAVIKRIWTLGMDSSRVQELAQVFLDSIGPRLTGTPRQKVANDWVVKTYQSWGIDAKNEQYGTWRGWRRGYSHIDLIAPRERTLEGTMLGYSPGTGKKDVIATPIVLPRFADSTEFVRWLPNAKGKMVLISAPMPTCRPVEAYSRDATPESKARMDSLRRSVLADWSGRSVRGTGYSSALGGGELGVRLEQAGAAGIITSRAKDGWGSIEIFETYNQTTPAIALSCEDYGLVFRLTERNQGPKLRLNLDAQLLPEQPVFNTIGMLRGTEKPNEYVMLSAHFDSWDGASGATDNGTGTLTMFEAMRILATVYPKPKRTIIVGHWAGEENGLVGSRAYSEDHPEVRDGLHALFNQDAGTGRITRIGGGGMLNSVQHIPQWLAKMPDVLQKQLTFNGPGFPSGGGSDDASFACWGAPAFGMGGASWDYGNYTWHTNRDTYDKVWFDDLKSNATIVAMLAYLASEDPTKVTRERIDPATAQQPAAGGRGGQGTFAWPTCQPAARKTAPRLR